MYTLFNDTTTPERGVRQPASFSIVRRRLRQNVLTAIRHCRENSYAVDNKHLLVPLINGLGYRDGMSDIEFYSRCRHRADGLYRANNITTGLRKSNLFTNGFIFEKGNKEALVGFQQELSPMRLERTWKRLEPVYFFKHTNTSLDLNSLYDRSSEDESDVSVIGIDIVALGMQYKKWMDEQKEMGREFMRTPMQFVFQYPLANALMSYHEVAYMNRLINLSNGDPVAKFNNDWPFYLNNFSTQVDRYLLDRVGVLRDYTRTFNSQLQHIAMPIKPTLRETIALPNMPINRQNQWAFTIARLPIVSFLAKNDFESGNNRNRQEAYVIQRSIRELKSSRALEHGLPRNDAQKYLDFIDEHILKYL